MPSLWSHRLPISPHAGALLPAEGFAAPKPVAPFSVAMHDFDAVLAGRPVSPMLFNAVVHHGATCVSAEPTADVAARTGLLLGAGATGVLLYEAGSSSQPAGVVRLPTGTAVVVPSADC
jgi:hypothetical protein